MKRTSIIWIAVLSVIVLAVIFSTYFLLNLKKDSLEKRGKQGITDEVMEAKLVDGIYKLKQAEIKTYNIAALESLDSKASEETEISLNELKIKVPYKVEKTEGAKLNESQYNSDKMVVAIGSNSYKENGAKVGEEEFLASYAKTLNTLINEEEYFTSKDIDNYFKAFPSRFAAYKAALEVTKDTPVLYKTDEELKNAYTKYAVAATTSMYNNLYISEEKQAIASFDKLVDGNIVSVNISKFIGNEMYGIYIFYNDSETEENVMRDVKYIINSMTK
ncbi:MAG: hypothetical protein RR594_06490 [Clostridia bacterium]